MHTCTDNAGDSRLPELKYASSTTAMTMRVAPSAFSERQKVSRDAADREWRRANTLCRP
jgi:hypothetical protein